VQRLIGGESISTSPERVRCAWLSLSHHAEKDDLLTVRCAQFLTDFRKENLHQYTANLVYTLQRQGASSGSCARSSKLINSDDV